MMRWTMTTILARVLALSSVLVLLVLHSVPAGAHEVVPAVADLSAGGGQVTLSLRLNAEAYLAGIDLDAVHDTDEAPGADQYDRLRALDDDALAQRLWRDWAAMLTGVTLRADGVVLSPALSAIEVGAQPDPQLARQTTLVLTAPLDPHVRSLTLDWPPGHGALILRQQGVADPFTGYLTGGTRSPEIGVAGGAAMTTAEALWSYVPVGFDHIVPKGLDHILFVLGLFFLGLRWRSLLWQVSAFTLAHTVTLALGVLGWVSVPATIVEPLIAASIVFVAVENVFVRDLPRWRPVVIFGFGLLHGLGFASVLAEFGLPQAHVIPALIGFNIGVEMGQIAVIALAAACVLPAVRLRNAPAAWRRRGAIGYGLSALGLLGLGLLLDTDGFEVVMEAPAPVFLWPVAALSLGCALALGRPAKPGSDGYRRFVTVPASLGIAAVGTLWLIERTLLA